MKGNKYSPEAQVHPHGWERRPHVELPVTQAVNVGGASERKGRNGQQDNDGQTSGDETDDEVAGGGRWPGHLSGLDG